MRSIRLLLILIVLLVPMHVCWGTDYTGFWKDNCSDDHGIQIKPTEKQLYSVSFCGRGGCFKPGEWTPNTQIEGDKKYKIISPTEIGIKREDGGGYFIYKKCASEPTWTVNEPEITEPIKPPDCSFATNSKEEGVIIAWVTNIREFRELGQGSKEQTIKVGHFRPFAILSDGSLKETTGSTIHKGQSFWRVLPPKSGPLKLTSVGSFFDYIAGNCVYFGSLGKSSPSHWTLLSSKPIPDVFRVPTSKDNAEFYRLNTSCMQQSDYPEGKEPPCVKPKLLAITNINKNGKPEYWATEPYLWDTGITVWENNNGVLEPLLQVCVGCSD